MADFGSDLQQAARRQADLRACLLFSIPCTTQALAWVVQRRWEEWGSGRVKG